MIDSEENKEYLPIQGLEAFNKATADLLLGPGHAATKVRLTKSCQSLPVAVQLVRSDAALCHEAQAGIPHSPGYAIQGVPESAVITPCKVW